MIFPGQASQFVGMAADLYESHELARQRFDQANEALDFDLKRLCFEGPLEELTETRYAQPAILVASALAFDYLTSRGMEPSIVAGHSLGEYSALVAAGVLRFEDALSLVTLRGRLMFESGEKTPGTMAAVLGLGRQDVEAACETAAQGEVLQLANLNSPAQMVISGAVEAVARGMEACMEAGAKKVVPLPVSGAFHSQLMASAAGELAAKLETTEFSEASIPVIANVTAQPTTSGDELKQLLIEQLTRPVLWSDSMQHLIGNSEEASILEVGPGRVLMGLMRQIDRSVKVLPLGSLEALEDYCGQEKEAGA
jgi:[acyl-carrier-protein] S-malonyltransferase